MTKQHYSDKPPQRKPYLKKRIVAKPSAIEKRVARNENRAACRDEDTPLTPRAAMMLTHYVAMEIPNQFKAYKMAGYDGEGQSAASSANQIFNSPNFQKALREQLVHRQKRFVVEGDRMLENLSNIANANMDDFCTWDNASVTLKASTELTRAQKYAVVEVKEQLHKKGLKTVSIKLFDKLRAIEMLCTHLGLLVPSLERGGTAQELAKLAWEAIHALGASVPTAPPAPTGTETASPSPSAEASEPDEPEAG
jgi:hypothetical protein